jgi:hypothetical protein
MIQLLFMVLVAEAGVAVVVLFKTPLRKLTMLVLDTLSGHWVVSHSYSYHVSFLSPFYSLWFQQQATVHQYQFSLSQSAPPFQT